MIRYEDLGFGTMNNINSEQVMVSTSGAQLLPEAAVKTLLSELLPLTKVLTPNLPEAKLLLREAGKSFEEPKNAKGMAAMAKALQELGPEYVLLKGGHLPLTKDRRISSDETEYHIIFNVLASKDETTVMESPYLKSNNTHGTGCSLAC